MQPKLAARFVFATVIFGLTATAVYAQTAATGAIRGTVVSPEGRPIPRSILLYGRSASPKPKAVAAITGPISTARTGSDGSFNLTGLATGSWLICVDASGYLDPCHWSFTPPVFTVAVGQAVQGALIRLDASYTLHVQVHDPQRLLVNEGKVAGDVLQIGARSLSGNIHPAALASSIPGERDYTVTVPLRAPAVLFISGGTFQLSDATAAPVASAGKLMEVAAPDLTKASASVPVGFTITGKH